MSLQWWFFVGLVGLWLYLNCSYWEIAIPLLVAFFWFQLFPDLWQAK